ncbi:hypothetical protein [Actinomadura atramentaria]|uniref:hypothetical protein n=1 Tax=Actinomadura atramentaria TaxID=1990 RepID=UPI00037659CD|nr:hypothetical protein [Actinomadura atramentaria]
MGTWFAREIVGTGRLRLFCFFVAFIGAFLFIRFSVRMIRRGTRWWPGNVAPGGHHVHHVVFGLVFMCVGGVGGFTVRDPTSAWAGAAAALFGVGTGLVLDEFALVLDLRDVYWSEQGRLSVEVVFIAAALCGLMLVGLHPLGIDTAVHDAGSGMALWQVIVLLLLNLALSVVTLFKGKVWTGLLGVFVTLFALVGAVRLARPGSPWAHHRYPEGSSKMKRARSRERRLRAPVQRFAYRVQDVVAGRPSGER